MATTVSNITRKHPDAVCEECPLYSRPCAPTQSPQKPKAAIVSRSPGYHEAIAGKPFSGPSGKVLDHLLKMNGVSRAEVLVTNTVLCAPDDAVVPTEAIKACAPRLARELNGISLVVACGREAVNELVGRGSIDHYRGYRIERPGRTIVATNNPALVLRDDSTFPNLKRDFRRAFHPGPPPILPTVEVIEDGKSARTYCESLLHRPGLIAADIESRGGISHRATFISVQFSTDGINSTVLGEREGIWEDNDFIRNYLRPLFESDKHTFAWHGGKFDTKIFRSRYDINARVDHDTMLLSYALDERSGTDERIGVHGLDYLLMDEFGWPHYSNPKIEKAKKTGIVENYDDFYRYAGLDVGGTYQLLQHQLELAKADDVLDAYQLLLRANELLIGIELHGMVYDVKRAGDIYEFVVKPEMDTLTSEMQRQIDNPILNPRSPTQLSKVFYEDWGIKHAMQNRPTTPTMKNPKRSVDDSAREEILQGRFTFKGQFNIVRKGNTVQQLTHALADQRREHIQSFVRRYHRFQKVQKQASTYILSLIERAEQDEDSRIYTQLNLHGTNSGRLSSSKPNLQNITRSKDDLPHIRKLFRAPAGFTIVQADFSQAELRCIAAFSKDGLLSKIYTDGLDLHNETARRFFGPDFTKEQRQTCKNVNFGVFYRQAAESFQEKHNIDAKRAQEYIDWVWKTFTGVGEWELQVEKLVHQPGQLVSPFGRKRRFWLIIDSNKQASYREGINFYPQSTASDLTLTSAIRVQAEVDRSKAFIVNLVHDSIVAEVTNDYVVEYSAICKGIMESAAEKELGWTLPFVADVTFGPTWGDCH